MKATKNDFFPLFALLFFTASAVFFGMSFCKWSVGTEPSVGSAGNVFTLPAAGKPVNPQELPYDPFFPAGKKEDEEPPKSSLILRGVLTGPESLVVLEAAGDPSRSWLAKEGDVILGEKILRIRPGQVTLKVDGGTVVLKTD